MDRQTNNQIDKKDILIDGEIDKYNYTDRLTDGQIDI